MIRILLVFLTISFGHLQITSGSFNLFFALTTESPSHSPHCLAHSHSKGMTLSEHSECESTKAYMEQLHFRTWKNTVTNLLENTSYRIQTVVIDPGHGGKDPGCHGKHSQEKHIALAVAKLLRDHFQTTYPDIKIILTRDKDVFIPLNERAAIANRNHADLFISIHCNAISRYFGTHGSETYVLGLHRAEDNLAVAKRENAAIFYEDDYEKTYDGFDPNSDEGHIILSMYQNAFLDQSILFATQVEHRFAEVGRKSRGVKQAGFLVLRETTMPSVLIETGFLTNRAEEDFLRTQEGQNLMAQSIFTAFQDYKKIIEEEGNTIIASMESTPSAEFTSAAVKDTPPTPKYEIPSTTQAAPAEQTTTVNKYYNPAKSINADDIDFSDGFGDELSENIAIPSISTNTQPTFESDSITSSTTPAREEDNWNMPIQYRVQLAASKVKLKVKESKWKDIPHVVEIVWEDGRHKYQIRNIRTLQEADKIRREMMHRGFMGVFILAYQGSERISVEEAQSRQRRLATGR